MITRGTCRWAFNECDKAIGGMLGIASILGDVFVNAAVSVR